MTPKAQSLPSCTAGPPRVPKQLAEMGSSVTAFFDLATGTLFCLGFFWQGGVFTFFLFFLFFLYWRLPRLFSPFRRADRPPLPRCLPRRESERPAPTRRPPPAAPGRGCSPRGPLPGSGRRQQAPDPNCHRRNKQANKQTRARFQICLPKPNEQSRPSARWHRRGRQGRLAGRGGGGPGTALPSPSPPGWPETTLGSEFSRRRCSARLGSAGPRAVVLKGAGGEVGNDPPPEVHETAGPPLLGSATAGKAPRSPGDVHARNRVDGQRGVLQTRAASPPCSRRSCPGAAGQPAWS